MIVNRTADGSSRVTETTDVTLTRGPAADGVWGLLLRHACSPDRSGGLVVGAASAGGGALYAKLVDTGIKDSTVAEPADSMPPGRTALALLVSHLSLADLQRELARFPERRSSRRTCLRPRSSAVQESAVRRRIASHSPTRQGWSPPTGPADPSGNASPSSAIVIAPAASADQDETVGHPLLGAASAREQHIALGAGQAQQQHGENRRQPPGWWPRPSRR